MFGYGVLGIFQHVLDKTVQLGDLLAHATLSGRRIALSRRARLPQARQFRPDLVDFGTQRLADHHVGLPCLCARHAIRRCRDAARLDQPPSAIGKRIAKFARAIAMARL